MRSAIAEDAARRKLHEEIAPLAAHSDEVLGRWAAVMLNADAYAEVIDHHVELASDISWLIGLLDNADPPEDHRRQRRASGSPAVQIEGQIAGDELAARVVVITQLAEELDRNTLDLALRIVPVEWWQARLGATVPPERRADIVAGTGLVTRNPGASTIRAVASASASAREALCLTGDAFHS